MGFLYNTLHPHGDSMVSIKPPPAKAIKILGTLRGDLVVQANDGGRYRYTCWPGDSNPACWRNVEIWEGVTPLQDISEEPIFTAPNPPGKAVDSVAVNSGHELLRQTNYAVLEDGSVWVWDYANLGTAAVVFLVLAVLGAAASYVIGSIVSFVIAAKL
jgi:hypothetical protein